MWKLRALGVAYVVLALGGLFALSWLARVAPLGWATLPLAFAFPVMLVALTGVVSRYEARNVPPPEPPTSILGRPIIGPIRLVPQWTTIAALSILWCTSLSARMFQAESGVNGTLVVVWWLSVAAFTGLILPRLLRRTTLSPSA